MRNVLLCISMGLLLAASPILARAQEQDDRDKRIRELNSRLEALQKQQAENEARMAELQRKLAATTQPAESARTDVQRAAARKRMAKDLEKHTREQIADAEALYQVANRKWRTEEGKESLRKMIEKYPDLNRTGCAILYMGQMSEGEERENYLKQAIENHSDCFYGNGAQVGPLARLFLGLHYKENGKPDQAKELFDQIRKDYPQAITHRGQLVVDSIPQD